MFESPTRAEATENLDENNETSETSTSDGVMKVDFYTIYGQLFC